MKALPRLLILICAFGLLLHHAHAQDLVPLAMINAGGDPVDETWTGDTDSAPHPNLLAGSANIEHIKDTPTADATVPAEIPLAIFETMRIDANQPEPYMEWNFVASGYSKYEVRLYFVEMSRCSVGSRVFDIEINGDIVEDDFDVYAAAGNQCNVGIMRSYIIDSYSGLDIRFPLANGKPSTVAGMQVLGYGVPPIEIYAGTGVDYYNGEDVPALVANMQPRDLAVNMAGDVYYVDNHERVRVVYKETMTVSTVLDVAPEFSEESIYYGGITLDTDDNLYFTVQHTVSGAPDYITHHQVRKRDATTGEITIIAGSEGSGYSGDGGPAIEALLFDPNQLLFDDAGNLYLSTSNAVRRIDATTGIIETIAGTTLDGFSGDGGLATDALLKNPSHMIIDAEGNLLIADSGNHRIRKIDLTTGIITTIAGSETNEPSYEWPGGGGFSGDGGPATEAEMSNPRGMAFDFDGSLIIADYYNGRLRRVDHETGIINSITEPSYTGGATDLWVHGTDMFVGRAGGYISVYNLDSAVSNLSASSYFIDFGYVLYGSQSDPVTVSLVNSGPRDIDVTPTFLNTVNPDNFSISPIPAIVPGNGSVQFDVTFIPDAQQPPQTTNAVSANGQLYRVNAGGNLLANTEGDWTEDTDSNPSSYLSPGQAKIETDGVPPTLDASVPTDTPVDLFTTKRLDIDKAYPNMSWSFPVTTGETYRVKLFFVEMSRCSSGNRVFHVHLENKVLLSSFDIFEEAGGCNIGIMRSFTVDAEDESLDLSFVLANGKPAAIAGIEIEQLGVPPTTTTISAYLSIEHSGDNEGFAIIMQGTTHIEDDPANSLPIADFDTSATFLSVNFTDTSSDSDGTITSWAWDFGDGNTSTEQSPVHTYLTAGTFDVTLTVTDNEGATASKTVSVIANEEPASEGITVSLPSMQGDVGVSTLIPITVADLTGKNLNSYTFTVTYDETFINITGADTTATLSASFLPTVNTTVPGQIIVAWGECQSACGRRHAT